MRRDPVDRPHHGQRCQRLAERTRRRWRAVRRGGKRAIRGVAGITRSWPAPIVRTISSYRADSQRAHAFAGNDALVRGARQREPQPGRPRAVRSLRRRHRASLGGAVGIAPSTVSLPRTMRVRQQADDLARHRDACIQRIRRSPSSRMWSIDHRARITPRAPSARRRAAPAAWSRARPPPPPRALCASI